jgi:dihydroflavonol-4-reductase
MSAPVLVTGATGFLGHTLCPYLVERGYRLRALVRPSSDYEFLRPLGVELAWGDVRDLQTVHQVIEGCQAIVHAAGKFRFWGPREDFFAVNLTGTRNVLEAALRQAQDGALRHSLRSQDGAQQVGVERFIYVSTIAVIGVPHRGVVIDEEYLPAPHDDYQRSKLAAEQLVLRYHQEHGLPTLVLRLGAFYGPGSRYAFNRLFFEDPLKGLALRVHRGRRISFPVYIRDVVQGIDLALKRGRPGEVYNVSGRSLSHQQIDDVVSRLLGYDIHRLNVPGWAMIALARVWTRLSNYTGREPYYPINLAPYVFCDWEVSSEKARRELGFVPTPFEKGARATLAWYHERGVEPSNWLARLIVRITWRKR